MNKYQEALDIINRVAFKQYEDVCYSTTKKSRAMNYESLLERSANTLQELVEKETSRKASKNLFGRLACDNCGISFQELGQQTYCKHCGQRIDWTDTD